MREKLEILSQGVVRSELELDKKEISIGRDPTCDVYLNDPMVSRLHAQLIQIFNDYYLEDMESTNGTLLNNRRVRKHVLKHGDVLQIGGFEIRFVQIGRTGDNQDELDRTMVVQAQVARPSSSLESRGKPKLGWVRYLSGRNKGETVPLSKSLFTIGRPGEKVAVITRRPQGFFLLHLGGDSFPSVNHKPVQRRGVELCHGDIVDVGKIRVEIILE